MKWVERLGAHALRSATPSFLIVPASALCGGTQPIHRRSREGRTGGEEEDCAEIVKGTIPFVRKIASNQEDHRAGYAERSEREINPRCEWAASACSSGLVPRRRARRRRRNECIRARGQVAREERHYVDLPEGQQSLNRFHMSHHQAHGPAVPSGHVVSASVTAPVRTASVRSAPVRSAPVRRAPARMDPVRVA